MASIGSRKVAGIGASKSKLATPPTALQNLHKQANESRYPLGGDWRWVDHGESTRTLNTRSQLHMDDSKSNIRRKSNSLWMLDHISEEHNSTPGEDFSQEITFRLLGAFWCSLTPKGLGEIKRFELTFVNSNLCLETFCKYFRLVNMSKKIKAKLLLVKFFWWISTGRVPLHWYKMILWKQ